VARIVSAVAVKGRWMPVATSRVPAPQLRKNAAVGVERALRQLLLEGVLRDLLLVELDPQPRLRVGADDAPGALGDEALADDVLAPGHVAVDRLADHVARLREAELERGRRADGTLRVVGRERDAVRLGERGDAFGAPR
jgi:hypothetical protein